jgi:hypothetical protein
MWRRMPEVARLSTRWIETGLFMSCEGEHGSDTIGTFLVGSRSMIRCSYMTSHKKIRYLWSIARPRLRPGWAGIFGPSRSFPKFRRVLRLLTFSADRPYLQLGSQGRFGSHFHFGIEAIRAEEMGNAFWNRTLDLGPFRWIVSQCPLIRWCLQRAGGSWTRFVDSVIGQCTLWVSASSRCDIRGH